MQRLPARFQCGVNLGNSLDCFEEQGPGTETSWGNPPLSREIIHLFASSGFDMLRLPVTWDRHFDPATGAVDPVWMARVHQAVAWGVDEGMTVILNTHHEFRWLTPELSRLYDILPRYRRLWQHIANAFSDYGEELIFQGTNEPNLMGGENCAWGSGNPNVRASINAVNHTFVSAVRETGGSNASRWLCIPGLAARPLPDCMKDMIMPKDDRLIYTIHCYTPDRFVFSRKDAQDTPYFDESCARDVRGMFEDIRRYALPHGVPVMITEFGAVAKKYPGSDEWNTGDRKAFAQSFLSCANQLDIPCLWWDNNYLGTGDEYFGLFDREKGSCRFPDIVQVLTENKRRNAYD